jgi:hemolysin activation/secretion protein
MSDPFNATSAINQLQPPGTRDVGQLGTAARFTFDSRDTKEFATRGVYFQLEGDYFPITWTGDVGPSGSVEGSVRTYLSPAFAPDRVTLALRVGGRQAFGEYPYFEAGFLGGKSTLRGYSKDRFAGDRAVYGIGELRLKVLNSRLLVPSEIGLLGLADIGKVWYQDSPGGWRNSVGGGLWISVLERRTGLTLGIAQGDQGSPRFWFTLGAPF